jgi:hypothetical protein
MKFRLFLVAFILAASPTPGKSGNIPPWPGLTQIVGPVNGAIAEYNADNATRLSSFFAPDAIIIDDLPPFSWRGSNAATQWLNDVDGYNSLARIKDVYAQARHPLEVLIENDGTAYAVVPVSVSFKIDGKLVRRNRLWTVTPKRNDSAWKITSASWLTQMDDRTLILRPAN